VTVLTGAGISAESGVPTFRGERGLWRSYRPEELATPEAFARDPELVWSWYRWRRRELSRCAPNPGHLALADLALSRPGVTLVTQNVDGLHHRAALQRAGENIPGAAFPIELHGSLARDRCSRCANVTPAAPVTDDHDDVGASHTRPLPSCTACGGLLRPDVVWFGEALDSTALDTAFRSAGGCDACLVVGTSALVHPAASVPLAAREAGALVIEVNLEPTPISRYATRSLIGAAGEVLPGLLAPGSSAHG